MTKQPTRSTTTKHLATGSGVVNAPRRDDIANDFLRARRAPPELNALELFPEERKVPGGGAVAVAAPTLGMAAAPVARNFAWPAEEEEWTPPVHVSPFVPQARPVTHWSREVLPIVAIVGIFLVIVASVGFWILRDIRATRASRALAASEPPPTIPPLKPRPLSWAQAAALADEAAASSTATPPGTPSAAAGSVKTTAPSAPEKAAAPADRPAAAATPPAVVRTDAVDARTADRRATAADRVAKSAARPPARATAFVPTAPPNVAAAASPVAAAASPVAAAASPVAADATPVVADTTPDAAVAYALPAPKEHIAEPAIVPAVEPPPPAEVRAVAAVVPPGGAAAAPVTAAISLTARDEDDIRRVLSRYKAAYSDLDPYAAREVWPTVDMRALTRAFDQLESQTLEFKQCRVSVAASEAVATCEGAASYVPKVGSRSTRNEIRRLRFDLHKGNEGWTIDTVTSR